MRTVYDQFAKQLLRDGLAGSGSVETDAEVSSDPQRVDVSYVPDPEPASAALRSALGLISRLVEAACQPEPFHQTPDADELLACRRKHLAFRHAWRLGRKKRPTRCSGSSRRGDRRFRE